MNAIMAIHPSRARQALPEPLREPVGNHRHLHLTS
jgi:hypothetical protein